MASRRNNPIGEPTDEELDQIEREIEDLDDSWIEEFLDEDEHMTVEEYLDLIDAEREEARRKAEDLRPERVPSGPKISRVRTADEPVQEWLARERQM